MRCLLVDDEYLALELLASYISKLPQLQVVAKCSNALQALEKLQSDRIDLLFLDIQMPDLTGLELLKTMSNPPIVILTTAYSEYAIEGYELNVLDYLLKPIPFERFVKAVNKAQTQFALQQSKTATPSLPNLSPIQTPPPKDYIMVKADYKQVKVKFANICYIEGLKEYVGIYTTNGKRLITHSSMKNILTKLPDGQFMRIHKSYIIALDKVQSFGRQYGRNRATADSHRSKLSGSRVCLFFLKRFFKQECLHYRNIPYICDHEQLYTTPLAFFERHGNGRSGCRAWRIWRYYRLYHRHLRKTGQFAQIHQSHLTGHTQK